MWVPPCLHFYGSVSATCPSETHAPVVVAATATAATATAATAAAAVAGGASPHSPHPLQAGVAHNSSLSQLCLSYNLLGSTGAGHFAAALAYRASDRAEQWPQPPATAVATLNLSGNGIGNRARPRNAPTQCTHPVHPAHPPPAAHHRVPALLPLGPRLLLSASCPLALAAGSGVRLCGWSAQRAALLCALCRSSLAPNPLRSAPSTPTPPPPSRPTHPVGAWLLSRLLDKGYPLVSLDLSENNIGLEGAKMLTASAGRPGSRLESLELSRNASAGDPAGVLALVALLECGPRSPNTARAAHALWGALADDVRHCDLAVRAGRRAEPWRTAVHLGEPSQSCCGCCGVRMARDRR